MENTNISQHYEKNRTRVCFRRANICPNLKFTLFEKTEEATYKTALPVKQTKCDLNVTHDRNLSVKKYLGKLPAGLEEQTASSDETSGLLPDTVKVYLLSKMLYPQFFIFASL